MKPAYRRDDLIGRHERWRMRVGCTNAAFLFGKPSLTVNSLDGLFWVGWLFQSELGEADRDAPINRIPATIVSEMKSGLEYIQHLSEWFFTKNKLACDYKYKDAMQFDSKDTQSINVYGVPTYESPYFTFPWIDEAKINSQERERRPSLTRKRVNGLWWLLVVWDLLEEDLIEWKEWGKSNGKPDVQMGWLSTMDTKKASSGSGTKTTPLPLPMPTKKSSISPDNTRYNVLSSPPPNYFAGTIFFIIISFLRSSKIKSTSSSHPGAI